MSLLLCLGYFLPFWLAFWQPKLPLIILLLFFIFPWIFRCLIHRRLFPLFIGSFGGMGETERRSEINRNSGAWRSNFWQINFRAPPEQRPTIDNLPKTLGLPSSTFGHHTTSEPDGSYQISISSSDRQTATALPSVPLLSSLFWYSCCFPSLVSPDQTHENGKWPMTHAPFPHRCPYFFKKIKTLFFYYLHVSMSKFLFSRKILPHQTHYSDFDNEQWQKLGDWENQSARAIDPWGDVLIMWEIAHVPAKRK